MLTDRTIANVRLQICFNRKVKNSPWQFLKILISNVSMMLSKSSLSYYRLHILGHSLNLLIPPPQSIYHPPAHLVVGPPEHLPAAVSLCGESDALRQLHPQPPLVARDGKIPRAAQHLRTKTGVRSWYPVQMTGECCEKNRGMMRHEGKFTHVMWIPHNLHIS